MSSNQTSNNEELIPVTVPHIVLCTVPLIFIGLISYSMKLELESPLIVGCFRTGLQLTLLALILRPIFIRGEEHWPIVIFYAFLMILVSSYESVQRTTYYFPNMYTYVLGCFVINTVLVSMFAFGAIVQPTPVWDPQYVIPMLGMLLGNSVSGASLAMKAVLTSLVEDADEIELYLSFGATRMEACGRLLREAVRTGALPLLNSMAVIGLVAIPGMMTGQILAGSDVMEAAHYQMVIMYLVALNTFGTILAQVMVVLRVGFDYKRDRLRTDFFLKREVKPSFIQWLTQSLQKLRGIQHTSTADTVATALSGEEEEALYESTASYGDKSKRNLQISTLSNGSEQHSSESPLLRVTYLACSLAGHGKAGPRTIIFGNISFQVFPGEITFVSGPSGVGKSTLLRALAGLTQVDSGEISLCNDIHQSTIHDFTMWRHQVRYVVQHKVSIPGTPMDFVRSITALHSWKPRATPETRNGRRKVSIPGNPMDFVRSITAFHSWKTKATPEPQTASSVGDELLSWSRSHVTVSLTDVLETSRSLLTRWGMTANDFLSERRAVKKWSQLSGGESQRVLVALALASKPRVLLLDECTSALDLETKTRVEQSMHEWVIQNNTSIVWVTHDQEQIQRMKERFASIR